MLGAFIKVNGTIARVVGLEKVRGTIKQREDLAFTALGTKICEKHGDDWLIILRHASKADEGLVS